MMALTWERTKKGKLRRNQFSRVDALAARRVLREAYRARHELAAAFQSGRLPERRIRWVTVITLLRIVGHALKNIDTRRSPEMAAAVKSAWTRWAKHRLVHLIFHEFIEKERNGAREALCFLLKPYEPRARNSSQASMPIAALLFQ
jgi:hypothetical protein